MSIETAKVKANFDRGALSYDDTAVLQREWLGRAVGWALEVFPERAALLDIGCGTGLFAQQVNAARPQWRITGSDISAGMCAAAASRCRVVQADAERLPFAGGAFDGAFSSLCLQWLNDKPAALREMARVLRPGAGAVILLLGGDTLKELRAVTAGDNKLLPMESPESCRAWIRGAGLDLLREDIRVEQRYYPSALDLLLSMKIIGAGNAMQGRPALRPQTARLVADYDRRYAAPQGVPATWQPLFFEVQKP